MCEGVLCGGVSDCSIFESVICCLWLGVDCRVFVVMI